METITTALIGTTGVIVGAVLTYLGSRPKTTAEAESILLDSEVQADTLNDKVLSRAGTIITRQDFEIEKLIGRVEKLEKQDEEKSARIKALEDENGRHKRQRRYMEELIMICIGYVQSLQGLMTDNSIEFHDMPADLRAWLDDYQNKK